MTTARDETLFTCVVRCSACKTELNRAEHVPEHEKLRVILSAPIVVGRCPRGCDPTFSDCNLNTDLDWYPDAEAPARAPDQVPA